MGSHTVRVLDVLHVLVALLLMKTRGEIEDVEIVMLLDTGWDEDVEADPVDVVVNELEELELPRLPLPPEERVVVLSDVVGLESDNEAVRELAREE